MDYIHLHRLLRYDLEHSQRAPIHWDLHDIPSSAHYCLSSIPLGATLAKDELIMSATVPAVNSLRIVCEVLPFDWPIVANNATGVTVEDVLHAIQDALQKRVGKHEWNVLSDKHQRRVSTVFDSRWQKSPDPVATRAAGVQRLDTLLKHDFFGGLTVIPAAEPTCVLTLACNRVQQLGSA